MWFWPRGPADVVGGHTAPPPSGSPLPLPLSLMVVHLSLPTLVVQRACALPVARVCRCGEVQFVPPLIVSEQG